MLKNLLHGTLKAKTRTWSYIKGLTARLTLWRQTSRSATKSPPSNLYRHCSDTPLSVFIDCVVDHNYNSLVRYGKVKQADLLSAWECLYVEYMDITGNLNYRQAFHMIREVGRLESRLMTVRLCHEVLRYRHSVKCVKILHDLGYTMQFDIHDRVSYLKDLEMLVTKSKAVHFELTRLRKEYELTAKNVEGKEITRSDFDQSLEVLSIYRHSHIDPKEMTLGRYAYLQKIYKKEVETAKERTAKYNSKSKTPNKPPRDGN